MTSQWHYTSNGVPAGPVTSDELKKLASEGKLKQTDLVWKDGMKDWVNADSLKNLFSSPPPLPNQIPANRQVEPATVPIDNPSTEINKESGLFKKNELMGILLLASPWVGLLLNMLLNVKSENAFVIYIILTGVLVFIDAKQLGIGDQDDLTNNGKRHAGPLACSIATAGLWFLAFPVYLYGRKRKGARNLLIPGIITVIICLVISISSFIKPALLNVDSPEVAQTLRLIIIEASKSDPKSVKLIIDRPIEISFDEEKQIRVGKTTTYLNDEKAEIEFSITWLNAKHDQSYIKLTSISN